MKHLLELTVLAIDDNGNKYWENRIVNSKHISLVDPCDYGSVVFVQGQGPMICNVHYELWRTIIRANHQGKEVGRDQ